LGGWIVETEAYLHTGDPASHSARGLTTSNASMFASPGTLYVYPIHAKYCLNAVTQNQGEGAAVLIRAIEPIWGIQAMQRARGYQDLRRLTRGPAMLCQAIGVTRSDDGRCLITDQNLGIFNSTTARERRVCSGTRIGISKAKHRNLRFIDPDSNFLSRPVH
jgi:DNA-3-methyladenine glycosylase